MENEDEDGDTSKDENNFQYNENSEAAATKDK